MRYEKIYISVIALFKKQGGLTPREIIWTDGKRFQIDKVMFVDQAPSSSGGLLTTRYTVLIGLEERRLFYEKENQRWFVEKKVK